MPERGLPELLGTAEFSPCEGKTHVARVYAGSVAVGIPISCELEIFPKVWIDSEA